ncbi:MAG: hypothetical protein KBS74_02260 [Clostridiales bacterium]|nr:hypothetical protein [Candidatus Cacconaster stercorequi]
MDYMDRQVGELLDKLVEACEERSTNQMQRNIASGHEAWAKLKELTESAKKAEKDVEQLQKECWEAVKDHNDEEVMLEMKTIANSARVIAGIWAFAAAIAARAEREV